MKQSPILEQRTPVPASRLFLCAIAIMLGVLAMSSAAVAGEFEISPMSLEMGRQVKSGALSILNAGKEKLSLQISVREWAQAQGGKDVYAETSDIVFFPKILTVDPGEQRIIRVGAKGFAAAQEKTYRLFLEEMPDIQKKEEKAREGKKQSGVSFVMQVSIPIFVKPLQTQERGSIEKVEMAKGVVTATVKNVGNVHSKFRSVTAKGKAIDGALLFSKEAAGWYILPGIARSYDFEVPADVCPKLSTIEIETFSDTVNLNGSLNVRKEMCAH